MKDNNNKTISEPYKPLVRYAHEIATRLLTKIHDIETGIDTESGDLSELVVLGKNVHGQYTLLGERQLLLQNEPDNSVVGVFEDRFTADKYMMTGTLEGGDLEEYVNIGKRKMLDFFDGQIGTATGRNLVTGYLTVFIRYGNYLAENFLPVDLYVVGEKFARANNRYFEIHAEDLLRGHPKTLVPKRVDKKVAILWPSERKKT